MNVKLKSITPEAEVNIVEIARVSSSRENKKEKPEGLINYLIKNNHWSPFEHSHITFEIITSKAIGIQLLRHRSFTFQEFSQRYSKAVAFETVELRKQAEINRQSSTEQTNPLIPDTFGLFEAEPVPASEMIKHLTNILQTTYEDLIKAGIAKECARMILPMHTQTTIYMTGSVRSWIHFLQVRDEGHAQKEIQMIAKEIKSQFKEHLPIIARALGYV
jgi:thymidylate synthase (FAD)